MKDGVILHANASVPDTPNEKFPVIIFTNSWGVVKFEYYFDVKYFAKNG